MNKLQKTLIYQHVRGLTGKLVLKESNKPSKVIYFKKGRPIYIESGERDQTLGQMLLKNEKITQEQYQSIIEKMKTSNKRFGEVLTELSILSPYEVYEHLMEQMKLKFESIFMSDVSEFEVMEDEKHLQNIVEYQLNDFRVFFDFLKTEISLSHTPELPDEIGLKLNENGKNYLQDKGLNAMEVKVIRLLDGRRNFSQISQAYQQDVQACQDFVYCLYALKFIDSIQLTVKKEQQTFEELSEPERQVVSIGQEEQNHDHKESPLYAFALKLHQPYHRILDVQAGTQPSVVQKQFEKIVRELSLIEGEANWSEKERELASKIFDALSIACAVLVNPITQKTYFEHLKENKSLAIEPKIEAEALAQKSLAFEYKKNHEQALKLIDQAILMDENEPSYLVQKAQLFIKSESLKQSPEHVVNPEIEKMLKKALSLKSDHDMASYVLGRYYKLSNQIPKAIESFSKVGKACVHFDLAQSELRHLNRKTEQKASDRPLFGGIFSRKKKSD